MFCSSLPHPTADKDYALYEVGTGCEVAELIPGIDLLSEAFRCNGRSILAALRWITEELARARYLITVRCYSSHSISQSPLQKREEIWGESHLAVVCGIVTLDLVHGPEPLKCTNSRDQPRVVPIWSLFEGDSKKLWYQSEIGSSFVFLKHWNIAKAPFCMKTRLNFKSSIECIVQSGSFIYEIKLQERSVFIAFLCYIWIFYKNGNIRSNSLRACTRNASWVNFNLDKLSQLDAKERANCNSTDSRRSSIRQPTANPGRIYQRVCIFCEKDKYTRNSRTTEEQCVDMHADETIRKAAAGKCDNRILAVISRELVVAEALYHKSCYRNQCTRNIPVTGDKKEDSEYTKIAGIWLH